MPAVCLQHAADSTARTREKRGAKDPEDLGLIGRSRRLEDLWTLIRA